MQQEKGSKKLPPPGRLHGNCLLSFQELGLLGSWSWIHLWILPLAGARSHQDRTEPPGAAQGRAGMLRQVPAPAATRWGWDGASLGKGAGSRLLASPGGSGNKALGPRALEWQQELRLYWLQVTKIVLAVRHKHGRLEALGVGGLSSDVGSLSEIKGGHHCLDFPETWLYMQCSYIVKEVHKS